MAAITTVPGSVFPASPTTRRATRRTATLRRRRPSPATFRRRRIAAVCAASGVVVVLAQAGVALGGSSLAASERRPTVAVAASSPRSSDAVSARHTPSVGGVDHADGDRLVVVRPGDTLWSIALRFDPDADPRPIVDELSAAREGAPLVPGETIRWPEPD